MTLLFWAKSALAGLDNGMSIEPNTLAHRDLRKTVSELERLQRTLEESGDAVERIVGVDSASEKFQRSG